MQEGPCLSAEGRSFMRQVPAARKDPPCRRKVDRRCALRNAAAARWVPQGSPKLPDKHRRHMRLGTWLGMFRRPTSDRSTLCGYFVVVGSATGPKLLVDTPPTNPPLATLRPNRARDSLASFCLDWPDAASFLTAVYPTHNTSHKFLGLHLSTSCSLRLIRQLLNSIV